jgi:hypothetical protein
MKLNSLAVVLGLATLGACEKGTPRDITAPVSGAEIKFFNFAVAAAPATTPVVNFYANNTKVSAILTSSGTESTLGTGTGAVGNGGFYSVLAPGAYTVTGRVAAAADNGVSIASLPVTLVDGKFYSFYMSGNYNTTSKTTEAFVVEDLVPALPSPTLAYVRFVNASANAAPMTLLAKSTVSGTELAIGAAVAYKAAGDFATIPEGVYDLSTRLGGSGANAVTRTNVSFLAGRVYTISAFGDATVTSATAANRIRLDNTTNR